jgi:hypothetical protein
MHDHPSIVLQAIQALKPHGLVKRISVHGRRVELHLEDGRILTRELPTAQTPAAGETTTGEVDVLSPTPLRKKAKRSFRKTTPKD